MSYTLNISISLGSSKTGIILNSQLVDSNGDNYGSPISSGFSEIGNGNYLWHYEYFPNNFRGGIKFYNSSNPSITLAFVAINPEDAETIDKINNPENIKINVGHSEEKYNVITQTPITFPEITIKTGEIQEKIVIENVNISKPKVIIRTGVR